MSTPALIPATLDPQVILDRAKGELRRLMIESGLSSEDAQAAHFTFDALQATEQL